MAIKTGSLDRLDGSDSLSLSNDILAAVLKSAQDLVTGKGWLESINSLLEEVGKATKVSRVWVFQTLELTDDYILQDYVFEWAAEEKYVQIGLPQLNYFKSSLDEPEYAAVIESRKRGEYQHMVISQLPECWLKTFLADQKILSMLTIPIIVENKWWGILGLDDCEREYEWSAREITLLRTASYFISSAVTRDSLNAKSNQLEILKENRACSSWELDIRRGHLWCTSEILTGVSETTRTFHFTLREWLRRIHPDHRKAFLRSARLFVRGRNKKFRGDLKVIRNDGGYSWVEISANNIQKDSVVAGIFWDITERKEEEEHLLHQATTDALTGIINRRKLKSLFADHIARYEQTKEVFSLAMLDLDHFKNINDTYGHAVGDKALIHFVNLCESSLRKGDYLARIGGEEFAILLSNTEYENAHSICTRICKLVREVPFIDNGKSIGFSVSIGCTTLSEDAKEFEKLLEMADRALYQAKQSGRNRVVMG
ncbi:diguanylate cyclase [Vibrio sp. JC009]|uniref:sensor domain-containing diguanylate cyclase n=1 Tax=Vibrio sp. JC009 TaxID=2912314 RepID=UPI0023B10D8E|nr:diguanylate cyclase [Vibrio sp. JC009]WED23898.1 diguanylate cyclase [Vibrio sp. JC009]